MTIDANVRVRFAPSPTGMLHIGGARTAIYNWAFARSLGGTFILRIEDTDPERSTEENTQIILRAMRWLGLDWDEGPEVGGDFGPYFQTERMATYAAALEELKKSGAAYPCFCTKEDLAHEREEQTKAEGGYSGYSGKCRNIPPEEALARIDAGEPHVWRLKVPADHGPIVVNDIVYGETVFPADAIDDLVLVRSDGSPTYNFAVVCDDANMGITHVIRGDDHLSNTPKQILIYEALGFDIPKFAHLPMILGPDGKKLSKRHGATNVEDYRDRGYLSDAMVNFLALLGWSLDGDTTIIPPKELCEVFSLERITKKDSIFDETKLDWMDGVYIREMSPKMWLEEAIPWIAQSKANAANVVESVSIVPTPTKEELEGKSHEIHVPGDDVDEELWQGVLASIEDDKDFYMDIYPLLAERMTTFSEISDKIEYLFWGPRVVLDEKSVTKVLKKEGARADEALEICRSVIANESVPFTPDAMQEECKKLGEEAEIKPRNLFQPLRVAVCGNMVSPPLFESIVMIGRDDVLARIDAVASQVVEG